MQEFRNYAPDVAVLSLTPAILLGRIAKLAHPKTKIVTYEHSISDRWGPVVRLALWLTSFVNDAVFGDTPATLKAIQNRYARRQTAYEVPPMIFGNMTGSGSPEKSPIIKLASFGRLTPQKNYLSLIQAVKNLRDEGILVDLTIAGEGRERPGLEKLVDALGLNAHVHLLGHISEDGSLTEILRQSHIYVQPSLFEGLCLACLEAMAHGKVVVASDVGGMKDYGRDGENMIKINGFDHVAIAAALRRTIDGYDELSRILPAAAVLAAQKQFQTSIVEQKWREAASALAALADR
jgi:glycosyltransferase involved in cell wall biosynthesis